MSKSLTLPAILVFFSLLFLAACTRQQELSAPRVESAVPQATQSDEIDAMPKSFTLAEVSKHNTQSDCWMAVEGEVYDVTAFVSEHPGGKDIVKGCGKDATELFKGEREHEGDEARNALEILKIGALE